MSTVSGLAEGANSCAFSTEVLQSDVDSSCSTTKYIDGGSPVTVAGTVIIEEDLIKRGTSIVGPSREMRNWSSEEPEGTY
jgi:hypothetical protein